MRIGCRIPKRPFIKPTSECGHNVQEVKTTYLETAFGPILIYVRFCIKCKTLVLSSKKDAT